MVIMALDHVRDFVTNVRFTPEDLALTWPALFFTRWITHFCAPVFFLLAGTGAYLSALRGKPTSAVSGFLLKRGLWLVLLEITIIDFGWTFMPTPIAGVVWALGWSMAVLAAVVWLPSHWVGIIGIAVCVGHHALDHIDRAAFGALAPLWTLLHQPGVIWIRKPDVFTLGLYSLIPWFGVMAAGYALGAVLKRPDRRRMLLWIGGGMTLLFFVLRATGIYGQPPAEAVLLPYTAGPFVPQADAVMSVVAFLNVNKYPPSLQFLLMTLGPSLMALAWFDRFTFRSAAGRLGKAIIVFGRVPMFFYILHIFVVHIVAVLLAVVSGQPYKFLLQGGFFFGLPPGYGHGLPVVYAVWIACIVLLYWPCAWYERLKVRRKDSWLRYV